ncbi:uncharacterized protein LOC125946558 [Dermacentor silvarum]|uniref:uncharacterized protein LOC125946558 n=1 Tax=Dermacentor silvarum TaxID=543639 RepID=UPI0021006A74|nr:uncharacterized protein LOC125946558 [Dermacentor silvarum]
MCINSRGEVFALSIVCAVYNVAYILIHGMNFAHHRDFAKLHGMYVAIYSMGLIIAVLFFVSILTRRATTMEVGVLLCKARIAITAIEIGYLGYRFALGHYDLPLHFFKRQNDRNAVPLAAASQSIFNKRPRSDKEWRKFYHVSYIGMETCLLIIDVYATWRMDLYVEKMISRGLFF